MTTTVHKIPDYRFDGLKAALDKLAKRAGKLGVPAPTLTVVGEETREMGGEEPTGFRMPKYTLRLMLVEVTGDAPKFDGWSPAAVIDLDPEDAPGGPHVVHVIGERDADPTWRTERDRCDHCTQSPRGRRKLVVVEHEDGTRKVVGTTCVHDFLGHKSPEAIAGWFEILASLEDLVEGYEDDEFGGGGAREEWRYDPADFLAWTASVIDKDGWVPRAAASDGRQATADNVVNVLADLRFGKGKAREAAQEYAPEDEHCALADRALEWARDITDEQALRNDYLANVQAVARKAGWRHKDIGLGASIVAAYKREVEREILRAKEREDLSGSEFVGAAKAKIEFTGTVIFHTVVEGYYGSKDLYKILTDDGNVLVWFSTSGVRIPVYNEDGSQVVGSRGLEQGEQVVGKATVKAHEEYRGVKQTIILRAKLNLKEAA